MRCDNRSVIRRCTRALWPLGLVLLLFTGRAAACKKKEASKPKATLPHWITPLMTPVPPKPTITLRPGVTRVPELPE